MKTSFALLITAALLVVGLPIPAHAATPFAYSVSGGNATITGYYGTAPSTLVIPDEISDGNGTYPVTAIGDFAFTNSQLTELTLPDSLTAIGNNAFYGNRLTELTLPDSLTAIGDNAFYLNQLTELTLSGALTTIGNFAFSHNQLTELTLPDALTTIGNFAFYSNKLTELTLSGALTTIGNSAFYNNRLTELAFPDALTTIGDSAFINNPDLDDVRFTGPAPTLGTDALGTSNPTVRFPWRFGAPLATNGYTTPQWLGYATIPVADVTFTPGGTIDAQLVDVDGTSTATKPTDPVKAGNRFTGWFTDGATTPFDFATPITGDTALTAGFASAVAPILSGPATTSAKLGAEVTWEPTALTGDPAATVTATGLPAGLTIDKTTGVISGKVTDPSLARNHTVTITASNGVDPAATHTLTISIEYFTYTVAGGDATITGYHGTVPTNLVIPDEITDGNDTYPVTTIDESAFNNNQLTELTLPNTLITIGRGAFQDNQLTELTFPNTLTTIEEWAFYNNQLTELTLPNSLTTIGTAAFHNNLLTELTLPNSLTTIGTYAFLDNTLATVRFTGTAPQIGAHALSSTTTPLPTVRFPWKFGDPRAVGGYTTPTWNGYTTVPVADVTFTGGGAIDAQLVDVDGTSTATKPADPVKAGNRFTGWFTDGATTPFDFATPITGDTALTAGFEPAVAPILSGPATTSAKLGAEVTWEPTTLTGDPAATVTATGLPAGLTIDKTTGTISGKVTDASLAGDYTITITASNGVDPAATHTLTISIEYFTYTVAGGDATITGYHGTVPTNLAIPDQITDSNGTYPVTAIGDSAFSRKELTELTLPNSITTIGSNAFSYNQLTELTLPDAITTISDETFAANQLTALTLPNTVTTIGVQAFASNQLTELTLPNTVKTLGEHAFARNQLVELTLPNSLTTTGDHAFYHNKLTKLTLPDTVTTISNGSFNDNQLAELTLPDTVTTIGDSAFSNNRLTELTLPNALTTTGNYAFSNNELTELTLPDTVTTISHGSFSNNQLAELTLPDTVTTIGDFAFGGNRLTELTVPDSATLVGRGAFDHNLLTDVVLGSAVAKIGDFAFDDQLSAEPVAVRFTGKAPEMGDAVFGSGDSSVRFPWKFGDPRSVGGYTTPTWHDYATIPVADVTFAGGGNLDAQSVDVDGTSTATKPADPVKAGHVFTGWFTGGATTPFDFSTPITGDTALTARFELPPVSPEPGPAPAPDPSPVVTGLDPAITGTVREGKTLRAKPGTITPAGATVAYQWRANGKTIQGATKSWLPLRKAQAGKRITVTITAKTTGAPAVTKTSAKTKPVSSAKRRLVLSTYRVGKNKPVTVTATGFTSRQKVIIWLGGANRYVGRADSRGVITKTVTFAKGIKPGLRRVRVSGYASDGDRNRTIVTTVRYR